MALASLVAAALFAAQGTARAATGPAWGYSDFIWISQFWYPNSPLTTDALLQASKDDGATIDRLVVGWGWSEPQNDSYDWQSVDIQYRAMAALGIRPVVTVYGAPDWATAGGPSCGDCAKPPSSTHYGDWQSFLQALIQHMRALDAQYPGFAGPKAIEVWNEPNIKRFFYPTPDAGAFVQLLKRARQAATATHFTQPIVSGALAPNTAAKPEGGSPPNTYLKSMYQKKFNNYVDGIGIHPSPTGSTNLTADMNGNPYYGIDTLDAIRRQNRDSHPFWITEVGVSSIPCAVPSCNTSAGDPRAGVNGDSAQGNALVDMYNSLLTRPVSAVLFYDFENSDPPNSGYQGFGVVDTSSGSIVPKQSFCILGTQIGNGNPGYGC
ncbi:MAG TPA: hypothetical protein VKG89_02545 [Solirubrobacterales bacterium]|nr:hypothetical protein [Solirubrobacterales bacterium]